MGCFGVCFGGGRRRRESRRRSLSGSPPREGHAALVGRASPLADAVGKEATPPLPDARDLAPPRLEVTEEVVTGASQAKPRETSEQRMIIQTSVSPTVEVAEEVTTVASPGKELSGLSQLKALPALSLRGHKKITTPISPVKCLPVEATVVSAPNIQLREVSEQESRSIGKKKVAFDMNATTYVNTTPSEAVECMKDEDEGHMQKTVLLPENHRYRNCTDSDDEDGDECSEDDNYGDDSDEEENFMDCKIELVDEEEISIAESKEESHESLFSLPMSNDRQNDQEVSSPVPKSSGTSQQEESPLIHGNSHRHTSQHVGPLSNPVQNLAQWKEVKAQAIPVKKLYKENVKSVPDGGASPSCKAANQTKMTPSNSSKGGVSVDASLSTWLVSSDNSTVNKAQGKSPRSISSVCREERSVLGPLNVDHHKQSSATSSPRRSPGHSREEVPILGTMGSYRSNTKQGNVCCSSRSSSGTNGIPNSTSKYREDRRVNWHSTPFNVRLDKALKKSST